MARVVASELEKNKISNDGPRYDAAYLKELKASTPSSRPRISAVEDPYDADMSLLSSDVPVQTLNMDVGEYLLAIHLTLVYHRTDEFSTNIPSESTIKVAKERRERLRKGNAISDEDFISLSVVRKEDAPQGPHPESRLMREEDEIGEGEDGEWVLFFPSPTNSYFLIERICGVHQCTGQDCTREEIAEAGSKQTQRRDERAYC